MSGPFSTSRFSQHIILLLFSVIAVSTACKQSAVFLCFSHTHNYLTKINSENFAFNEEELNQLCRDLTTIEDCLMTHNCFSDDLLIKDFSDWIKFKSFSTFICNSEYLEHQPCFSEKTAQVQLMNCAKLSEEQTFNKKDLCRGTSVMAECAALVVENCGIKTTNYTKKMIKSLTSECDQDSLDSDCSLNTLEFCFQSTLKFANLTPLHKQIHISNESNFEQVCRSINWVKGCLMAYGCDSSDSLTFSSLVKFHQPLSFLCYSDSQHVIDVFSQDTCRPGCYNAGEVATYTTDCQHGFTIYLDQPKCSKSLSATSTVTASHSKNLQPGRKHDNSEVFLSPPLGNYPSDSTETERISSNGKEVSSKVNAESYRGISEGNRTRNYIKSGEQNTQESDVIEGINLTSVPNNAVMEKSPNNNKSTELNIIQKAFATDHLLATFVGFGGGIFIGVLAAFTIIYLLVSCRRVKQYNRLGPFNNSNGESRIYKPTIACVPKDGNGSKNSLLV